MIFRRRKDGTIASGMQLYKRFKVKLKLIENSKIQTFLLLYTRYNILQYVNLHA